MNFFENSAFLATVVSLGAYFAGVMLLKRTKLTFLNPLLTAVIAVIALLYIFDIDYRVYNKGLNYLNFMLTPATICLAIPAYEQYEIFKKNYVAVLSGTLAGVMTNLVIIYLFSLAFGFTHTQYVTLLPKSVTTAIGIGLCEQLGGNVSVTTAVIIFTGVFGNIIAVPVCRLLHIKNPVAQGTCIGSSSHAVGTLKALEMGYTQGSVSSIALVVTGLLTVVATPLFALLI